MRNAVFALVILAASCAPRARVSSPPAADYPGELVSPDRIPGDFLVRQHVQATWTGGEIAFDAVLQKKGDTLTLIGLAPFGARAFSLVQTGLDVTFNADMPRELPFPPRNILLDVHRALFIGLPEAPPGDGIRAGERAGEKIEESWASGRLRERRFARLDGKPAGTITVTYDGGMAPGIEPPPFLTLDNAWFGYRLTVETESFQRL